jgi:NAD(P)H-flavin reductase
VLEEALDWLVGNLDKPQVVVSGCAQLGPAVAAVGLAADRLEPASLLLAEALLAGLGPLAPEQRAAWQETTRLVARWVGHGARTAAHEPPYWTATVLAHRRLRQDLAVLLVRPYLPYAYRSGQHTVVETRHHPDLWRSCWVANAPAADNVVELHVRAAPPDPVGLALVGRVRQGDKVRLRPAEGPLVLDDGSDGQLLLVAEDTGIAPMRALLAELRHRRDPRAVHLLWLTNPNEEPYELAAVTAYADASTTVLPLSTVADLAAELAVLGPSSVASAYVAGTPTGVAAAVTTLGYAGVSTTAVRHDQIGPDDE